MCNNNFTFKSYCDVFCQLLDIHDLCFSLSSAGLNRILDLYYWLLRKYFCTLTLMTCVSWVTLKKTMIDFHHIFCQHIQRHNDATFSHTVRNPRRPREARYFYINISLQVSFEEFRNISYLMATCPSKLGGMPLAAYIHHSKYFQNVANILVHII